jgi:sulfite reductase (ferredoxin)
MTTTPRPESPAQKAERVKREKPSWSILEDIRRYAREGFDSIPDDDLNVRFRAWGIYTQGDGAGTRGGAVPYFMMRVRTPNGVLNSKMVRMIADHSARFGRNTIDITNRQNFQLHWLRIEDIPTIWDELETVGWMSMGSCGDNTRTVTGCPLCGVDADELIDASPIAIQVDRLLNGNPDYANLPRKFKISISGCSHWCTYPEINDIGVTAARRGDEIGFHVRVGGGLSTRPHLAVRLNAFLQPEQVRDVCEALVGIFRDSDELRRNRAKARFKFVLISGKYNADTLLEEVERRIGYKLSPAADEVIPEGLRDHVGINPQKQPGLFYAGFSVSSGRASPEMIRKVADIADEFGDGTIRTTAMQNIVVLNVPAAKVDGLRRTAADAGLHLEGSPFQRGTVSCTGSEFCKLAITETKALSIRLAQELERRMPDFGEHISIHLAGCPNACGQHWIADIGLQGVLIKDNGVEHEGFDILLGGGLGVESAFATRTKVRARATDLPDVLTRLLTEFKETRVQEEPFRKWAVREGADRLRVALGGGAGGDADE